MLGFSHKLHVHSPCSPENYILKGKKASIIHWKDGILLYVR